MNLQEIITLSSSELLCKEKLFEMRLESGVVCKKCSSKEQYWLKTIEQFKCKSCGFKTTLKSGTIMESSRLPIKHWFLAIYLMTYTKKGISALELQRQLGLKRYQPVWYMMQKIRVAMGVRDDQYTLNDSVEIDEGFLSIADTRNHKPVGHARGSIKKKAVLVMAESLPGEESKHRPNKKCRFFKMKVIDQTTQNAINYEVKKSVLETAAVRTDGYHGYRKLKEVVKSHIGAKFPPSEAEKILPWVHILISNAKRTLLGIYHRVNSSYLQNYLNEFCYRLNRRYMKESIFKLFIRFAVTQPWYK